MSILGGMQGHTGCGGIIFTCSSTDGEVKVSRIPNISMDLFYNNLEYRISKYPISDQRFSNKSALDIASAH